MSPERLIHTETKFEVVVALKSAIQRAGAPCHAVPDGATVRIDARTAFEPDALVIAGRVFLPTRSRFRPSHRGRSSVGGDGGARSWAQARRLFLAPSVAHYLILDPERRTAIWHKRGQGEVIETRILATGPLRLDPPGLEIAVEELFAPA